jgi:hypothetical protein
MPLLVTDISFRRAPPHLAATGLVGFVTLAIDETVVLRDVAVRRTRAGHYGLSFAVRPPRALPLRGANPGRNGLACRHWPAQRCRPPQGPALALRVGASVLGRSVELPRGRDARVLALLERIASGVEGLRDELRGVAALATLAQDARSAPNGAEHDSRVRRRRARRWLHARAQGAPRASC